MPVLDRAMCERQHRELSVLERVLFALISNDVAACVHGAEMALDHWQKVTTWSHRAAFMSAPNGSTRPNIPIGLDWARGNPGIL